MNICIEFSLEISLNSASILDWDSYEMDASMSIENQAKILCLRES